MSSLTLEAIRIQFSKATPSKRSMEELLKASGLHHLSIKRNKHGFVLSCDIKDGLGNAVLLSQASKITAESFLKATQELSVDVPEELLKAENRMAELSAQLQTSINGRKSIEDLFYDYERVVKKLNLLRSMINK